MMSLMIIRLRLILLLFLYFFFQCCSKDFDKAHSTRPKGHCVVVSVTSEDPDDGFKPMGGKVQVSYEYSPVVSLLFLSSFSALFSFIHFLDKKVIINLLHHHLQQLSFKSK